MIIKKRKVSITILLNFLTPGLGYLYNGKPLKWALYLLIIISVDFIALFVTFKYFAGMLVSLTIHLALFIYVFIDTIKLSIKNKNYNLKKYNKWLLYMAIIALNIIIAEYPKKKILETSTRYTVNSMISADAEPTLLINDRVVIDRFYFRENEMERGDLVILEIGDDDYSNNLVKRCVGLPGDKVEVKDYLLYINDELVDTYSIKVEPEEEFHKFLSKHKHSTKEEVVKLIEYYEDNLKNDGPIIVEDNTYYFLGDNRTNSVDSRQWGLITKEKVVGKALYIAYSRTFSRIGQKI